MTREADERETHLYQSVADELASMISAGTLLVGERMPSVRELGRQRRLSVSTVVHAYHLLEDRGLIEARPRSGYFVRASPMRTPEPSVSRPPRAPQLVDVDSLVNRVLQGQRLPHRVRFGIAVPDVDLLPARKVQRIVSSIARRHPGWIANYSFPPGEEPLRRQIARFARGWGVRLTPDDIIVTNGCMEALNLALRTVAKPGDVIALESPTYFGLLQLIESYGMKALEIPTDPRTGISLEALESAIERGPVKACLLMPTVSNPLGSTMPDAAKKRLVHMLARHDIPLIEDTVYAALHFGTTESYAAKAYDTRGNVILCSSFSKTLSPGLRIGWIAPGRHYEAAKKLKFVSTIGVPELTQSVVAEFLASGGYHRYLRKLRGTLAEQVVRYSNAITRYFPLGTCLSRPSGGCVLWIEMPEGVDGTELQQQALRHGIGVSPGAIYSATPRYRHCLRINCGLKWTPESEAAIMLLGELATKLHARTQLAA
jgi:DNA-binding transcriptional MocR family regulator